MIIGLNSPLSALFFSNIFANDSFCPEKLFWLKRVNISTITFKSDGLNKEESAI